MAVICVLTYSLACTPLNKSLVIQKRTFKMTCFLLCIIHKYIQNLQSLESQEQVSGLYDCVKPEDDIKDT
jgi:hypothetical protein